jgi:hypothetical protein
MGDRIGAEIRAKEVDEIKNNTDNFVVSLAQLDGGWKLVIDETKKVN